MNRFGSNRPSLPPSEKAMRSVFVGNIGYDVSEQELTDIFSRVGQVVSFRLVHDRESGKSKGFGFVEYRDPETANACVRSMNHFELKGRNLRLDSAVANERMMYGDDPPPYRPQKPSSMPRPRTPPQDSIHAPVPLDGKVPEAIAKALNHHSPQMIFDVISDMKHLATTNPAKCRLILDTNPQLAFALLQAQVMMHWMDTDTAFSLLDRSMNSQKMAERAEISAREEAAHGRPHNPPMKPQLDPQPSGPPQPNFYNPGPPPPQAFRHPQPPMARPQPNWNQNGPPQMRYGAPPNYGNNYGDAGPHHPRYGNPQDGGPMQQPGMPYGMPPMPRPYGGPPMRNPNFNQFPGAPQQYRQPQQMPRMPLMSAGPSQSVAPPPPQGLHHGGGETDDMEMIQQLLQLTDEQLNALDPEEAAKIRELKKQLQQ